MKILLDLLDEAIARRKACEKGEHSTAPKPTAITDYFVAGGMAWSAAVGAGLVGLWQGYEVGASHQHYTWLQWVMVAAMMVWAGACLGMVARQVDKDANARREADCRERGKGRGEDSPERSRASNLTGAPMADGPRKRNRLPRRFNLPW